MTVAFNNTPGDIRVPLFYAEVNAGVPPYSGTSCLLLLGRKLAGSALPALAAQNIGSTDPNYLAGRGSMLADMIAISRYHNPVGETWVMDVGDPAGATAATGTLTITGTATAPGTLVRYIAGERYSVGVALGDTPAIIAAAFAAVVGKGFTKYGRRLGAPVVATAAAGVVTLTAQHTGVEGNAIRIETGLDGDEVDPAGITVAIGAMANGAGVVDLAVVFAALGNTQFDWLVGPYASVAQLNAARDFLSDSGTGRWSPTVGLDGHYITINNGNLSAQTTLGSTRNDRHATILGTLNYPQAPWSIAAGAAAITAFSKNLGRSLTEAIEIARPLQTLVVTGIRPPKALSDRWGLADRDSLYRNGISAFTVNNDGTMALERVVTTYQTNLYGQADITFLDIETIAIAAYVKRYIKLIVTSTYPRHVLRDDNPGGLQGVVTPAQMRSTMIHAYTQLSLAGLVEKPELFTQYLIVERSGDPNRLNAYLPTDVANQFRVFAANITLFQELTDQNASLQ
ncbi:phage tail sheath subtilisin-like domain-containing protein [Methylobacterium sp. E-041]|uniref:phage tail sheath subtilisin-like domain-containing protein n=1 Tax=Methylobacterium sp. E-041 TaxID=2836573 RepID=UPI001FB99292|nr:phage tail sheath subtilisin-like domain-containing protein [Methylobacterium sp. E-041]MCJ2108030.1 phage tail sheath subtilisin-like domain-containing protein [Methylobacterium sp. E-041]